MDGDLPDVPASSPEPTRTRKRACTSKVRTGCITCKERRVKCDEVKPTCLRCAKAGQLCKGYTSLHREEQRRPPRPEPVICKAPSEPGSHPPTWARNHRWEGSALHPPPAWRCPLLRLLPLIRRGGAVRLPPFLLLVPHRSLRDSDRSLHPPRHACLGCRLVPFGASRSASCLALHQPCQPGPPRQGCNMPSHKSPGSVS